MEKIKKILGRFKSSRFGSFAWDLYKGCLDNGIFPLATTLTYRFIFALFPFLIFLISLVGYFNIDSEYLMNEVSSALPAQIAQMVNDVINEVVDTRSPGVLSVSLLLSLWTVALGFNAVMLGINRVYKQQDSRNFIVRKLFCLLLVLVLAFAIITSLLSIIYRNLIYATITKYIAPSAFLKALFGFGGIALSLSILLFAVILIYRLSSCKKLRLRALLPGAALTIAVWGISTWGFNFYIAYFSNHSLVYGSIASIFITMLWLNIISITILVGAQLNYNVSKHRCANSASV